MFHERKLSARLLLRSTKEISEKKGLKTRKGHMHATFSMFNLKCVVVVVVIVAFSPRFFTETGAGSIDAEDVESR